MFDTIFLVCTGDYNRCVVCLVIINTMFPLAVSCTPSIMSDCVYVVAHSLPPPACQGDKGSLMSVTELAHVLCDMLYNFIILYTLVGALPLMTPIGCSLANTRLEIRGQSAG